MSVVFVELVPESRRFAGIERIVVRYLLYSDLHLRVERIEDCERVLDEVGRIALEEKVDFILNGGDTFQTRGLIRTVVWDLLYRKYREWALKGLKQIILVGNHDQEDREGEIHPLKVFEVFPGWHVVDRMKMIKGIPDAVFSPFLHRDVAVTKVREFWSKISKYSGPKQFDLFCHWGISGAKRNDFNTDTDGVPVEELNQFRRVFSGHYHFRNTFKNVHYIGSPIQQNFGEMNQDKGIQIYGSEEKVGPTFQEIHGTQKHREVEVHWNEGKATFKGDWKVGEKDCTRVKVYGEAEECSKIDQNWLRNKLASGQGRVTIERIVKEKFVSRLRISAADVSNHESLMGKYLDFVDTDLDKAKLLKIGKEALHG